jgi:hypothetical protein
MVTGWQYEAANQRSFNIPAQIRLYVYIVIPSIFSWPYQSVIVQLLQTQGIFSHLSVRQLPLRQICPSDQEKRGPIHERHIRIVPATDSSLRGGCG